MIDKTKRKSKVDPTTGDISYVYSYENRPCAVEEVQSILAKRYVAYDLINHDLQCAIDWIEQAYLFLPARNKIMNDDRNDQYLPIDEKRKESLIMSLFISSITYYGKCFTNAEGRGVKLEKHIIPENYLNKHKIVMDFRHTIAAHSGKGNWDTGKLMLISSQEKNQNPFIWSELKMLSFFDDREDENTYIQLINEVRTNVSNRMNKLAKKILSDDNIA